MRDDLPIVPASSETLYRVLKALLATPRAELAALGRRSRAFVEKWHGPLKIARDLQAEYNDILSAKRGLPSEPRNDEFAAREGEATPLGRV